MSVKSSHPISVLYVVWIIVLPVSLGAFTGVSICPTISLIMANIPVPYEWIELQPVHQRGLIFLLGALGIFMFTTACTSGLIAIVLGFFFRRHVFILTLLLYTTTAMTYASCIFDESTFAGYTPVMEWLLKPMNIFYLLEFGFLFMLVLFMSWLGSLLGRVYVLIRDSYNDRYTEIMYSR